MMVQAPSALSSAGGQSVSAVSQRLVSAAGAAGMPVGPQVAAVAVRSTGTDPDVARVQAVIQQLMDAVLRVCVKCGYTSLLSASGFGAWFNLPAAAQADSKEPLAILVFPDKQQPQAQLPASDSATQLVPPPPSPPASGGVVGESAPLPAVSTRMIDFSGDADHA
jgi:hypothetical protein